MSGKYIYCRWLVSCRSVTLPSSFLSSTSPAEKLLVRDRGTLIDTSLRVYKKKSDLLIYLSKENKNRVSCDGSTFTFIIKGSDSKATPQKQLD